MRGPTISPRLIRSRMAMSMYWSEPRSRTVVTPASSVRIAPLRAKNTSTAGELFATCFSIGTPGVSSVYSVMCVCTSINPGSPKYFVRSTTSACAGILFASVVTSRTRSPSTITIALVQTFPFPSHNFPNFTAFTACSPSSRENVSAALPCPDASCPNTLAAVTPIATKTHINPHTANNAGFAHILITNSPRKENQFETTSYRAPHYVLSTLLREPLRTLRRRLPRPVGALSFVRPDPRSFLCLFYSSALKQSQYAAPQFQLRSVDRAVRTIYIIVLTINRICSKNRLFVRESSNGQPVRSPPRPGFGLYLEPAKKRFGLHFQPAKKM